MDTTEVHDDGDTTRKAALTYDALGRRIEVINDVTGDTVRYYYDGVNEIVDTDESNNRSRYYVHGISYVDERLMMHRESDSRPYYYVIDRMYNVRAIVDRAGAVVERIAYDPYGRPLIRESAGRGDMDDDTDLDTTDQNRLDAATATPATIWDPRADLDDDADMDATDASLFGTKIDNWPPIGSPTVKQAFSDVDNPFLFQGRPHFAFDTAASATVGVLMINDHRARLTDVVTGRWNARDPLAYDVLGTYGILVANPGRPATESARAPVRGGRVFNWLAATPSRAPSRSAQPPFGRQVRLLQYGTDLYQFAASSPQEYTDPSGLIPCSGCSAGQCRAAHNALTKACECIKIAAKAAQNDPNVSSCIRDKLQCMKGRCSGSGRIHVHCDNCCLPGVLGHAVSCFLGIGNHVTICKRALDDGGSASTAVLVHEISHCCQAWDIGSCSAYEIEQYVEDKCGRYISPY